MPSQMWPKLLILNSIIFIRSLHRLLLLLWIYVWEEKTMELTIKDKTYPLKASFAFLRKIESKSVKESSGEKIDIGLANTVIQIRDAGDMRELVDLVLALNTGQSPKLEKGIVENYVEECEDIEGFVNEVLDFLFAANVCKLRLKKFGLTPTPENEEEKEEKPDIKS